MPGLCSSVAKVLPSVSWGVSAMMSLYFKLFGSNHARASGSIRGFGKARAVDARRSDKGTYAYIVVAKYDRKTKQNKVMTMMSIEKCSLDFQDWVVEVSDLEFQTDEG